MSEPTILQTVMIVLRTSAGTGVHVIECRMHTDEVNRLSNEWLSAPVGRGTGRYAAIDNDDRPRVLMLRFADVLAIC